MAIRYVVPITARYEDELFNKIPKRQDIVNKLIAEVVVDVTEWGVKPFEHVSDMMADDLMDQVHDMIEPLVQQRLNLNDMDTFIFYSDGVDFDFKGIHPVH